MPQVAALAIPAAIGGISGALKSGGKKSEYSKTTSPTMSEEFQPLQSNLISSLSSLISDPSAGTEQVRTGLLDQVNRNFAGMPGRVGTALAKRGFATSGKMGASLKGLELARSGQLSDVNTSMAQTVLQRQLQGLSLVNAVLGNLGKGYTESGTSTQGKSSLLGGILGGALQGLGGGLAGGFGGGSGGSSGGGIYDSEGTYIGE